MRYMRWSYDQLIACPDDYIEVIVEEQKQEAAEARASRKR